MPPAATEASAPERVFRSRPVVAVLLVGAAALVLELTPGLSRFRLFGKRPSREPAVAVVAVAPATSVGESKLGLETTAPAHAPGTTQLAPAEAQEARALEQAPPVPLLDPSGKALDGFFAALTRTANKQPGAITRIAHFGDCYL